MNWYYLAGEQQIGPIDEAELKRLVEVGSIRAETLVWHEGMPSWVPYRDLPADSPADPDRPTACSQCGRPYSGDDLVRIEGRWICAECKPVFVQRLKEGSLPDRAMRYGGFWIRFLARVLDGIILAIANTLFVLPFAATLGVAVNEHNIGRLLALQGTLFLLQIAAAATYESVFVGKLGGTPGKLALGLRIVLPDGGKVGYPRAVGRYFATFLSGMILMIGYIIAAFDREKRALHDHICTTRVVRV